MDFIKKNITLVLGISIPILMIVAIAVSIYLPSFFVKAHYNFLYIAGTDYYSASQYPYSVENGRLVKNEIREGQDSYNYQNGAKPKLYVYDVNTNKSKEISVEEAQNLSLDSNTKSEDGFEVVYGSSESGIAPLFFGSERDYNSRYLKGHGVTKKLDLQSNSGTNFYNFIFLGWIK